MKSLPLGVLVLGLVFTVLGAPSKAGKKKFPFSHMIAFGDNLSDNGNGSYAHHVANPKNPLDKIYGFRTWTDGPVAVSYLSTLLGVPLSKDYAFGHLDGGSKIGATINSSYTFSEAPDGFHQVANYTSDPSYKKTVKDTLHFVWIGNNDISLKHIQTWNKESPAFAQQMSSQMSDLVGRLIHAGSQHVFVVGLYPKNISPSRKFLCSNDAQIDNLGKAITQANAAIKNTLQKKYGKKVIYFDSYSAIMNIYNKANKYGIKYLLPNFCDGDGPLNWKLCVTLGNGGQFFWMQYTDMTSHVDKLLAEAMNSALRARF